MATTYYLSVYTESDSTFGSGESLAGLIDVEIEHDADGCPFLNGRALKGLLFESYRSIETACSPTDWQAERLALFGETRVNGTTPAAMQVSAAQLPADLRQAIRANQIGASRVLASLTGLRRQTKINSESGGPSDGSLRTMRVLLRGITLIAEIRFDHEPRARELALLAACVLGVRRAGVGRNRGRGQVSLLLHETLPTEPQLDPKFTQRLFDNFAAEVAK